MPGIKSHHKAPVYLGQSHANASSILSHLERAGAHIKSGNLMSKPSQHMRVYPKEVQYRQQRKKALEENENKENSSAIQKRADAK